MKHNQFIMPLFTPDIIQYIIGRDVVCNIMLDKCKEHLSFSNKEIILKTKLFTDLHFDNGDIIEILLATGAVLQIKMSYKLLLMLYDEITVEELATHVWKHMCRVVRDN